MTTAAELLLMRMVCIGSKKFCLLTLFNLEYLRMWKNCRIFAVENEKERDYETISKRLHQRVHLS
jgi:hypothetical protein